ncbi:unnamed protein product [Caenorhabditis sp. 36 PRJEB53466]|nr:unnamed protein product [Caenorhabditis sp. 36 PRJEB53466]
MMGVGSPGEIGDMLSMCTEPQKPFGFITMIKKKVVVTGFGPFQGFAENPSSIVVDELQNQGVDGVYLELHKIPVAYEDVSQKVPELWKEHSPDLVIHIGAHPSQKTIKFEQQAFSDGYCRDDVNGCTPEGNKTGCKREDNVLVTCIDCEDLAKQVTERLQLDGQKHGGLKVEKSADPGRYLCGFSYFLSLHEDCSKALFIHVPPFEGECTKEAVTDVIREAIKVILNLI